jgi:glyoxylase-like metal-dependent hydrolase (beta-lactamase superfamily II)
VPGGHAQTTKLEHGITAVDTEYDRPLHDASHLINEGGKAAFVDTGVNDSVPLLLDALAQQGLEPGDVEFVFVTHVHLDHAGGAGSLMRELPNARCVLHPRGAPHMIDPAKLVAGTEAVYGKEKARRLYGVIRPIAEERVVVAEDEQWFDLNGRQLQVLFTEGHARHHYVLNDPASRGVFTGDSFGVSYREHDTVNGPTVFPTTTPVHFDPDEAHKAVDRIMALEPEQLYLTHYSRVTDVERLAAEMHAALDAYVAMALAHADDPDRREALQASLLEFYAERLGAHGYTGDIDSVASSMHVDIPLNAQGLEVWLDRQQ